MAYTFKALYSLDTLPKLIQDYGMAISQDRMLQAVYDALFGAFTKPPVNSPTREGGLSPDSTFLALNWPGVQIDVADFAGPWSPINSNGNMFAAENFSKLVDNVPSLSAIYSPNGEKVSDVYKSIVNAHVSPPPQSDKDKQDYERALKFLTQQVDSVTYDDNGAEVKTKITADSGVYANYKKKLKAYDDAVVSMISKYGQLDMAKASDQRTWSLLGPTYQDAVDAALNDLRAAQDTKVKDMLAILAQSSVNQVGQLFMEARDQFNNIRYQSALDPGKTYRPAQALPGNWFAPGAADQWTDITISSGSLHTAENSDFSKISSGGSASWGLWQVGGSFDKEDSHQSTSKDTENLEVSFKYARVDILRPWLNMLLFSTGGWDLGSARKKDGISNGTKNQPNGNPFPLLPTSFIAVRNVKISAKWGHEDSSLITSKLKAGSSFGWGPFKVSGSYEKGESKKSFNSEFDGTSITNNGLQILGWVCTVVPACPPLDASLASHA
jgi:hypothetical protein